MKSFDRTLTVIALAIGVATLSACASIGAPDAVPGMKIDNGLGQLPHYRDWVDPSGRTPMEPMVTAEATRWP